MAAAIAGALLVWRPADRAVTLCTVVGVGWLVVYAGLTVEQRAELVAWTTDVFLGALGLIAAGSPTVRGGGKHEREAPGRSIRRV